MAEYLLRFLVEKQGLAGEIYCSSAATSTEELGNGVHPGTRRKLQEQGIPCGNHRARQLTRADYAAYDLLLGMDGENLFYMNRILGGDPRGKIHRLLDFSEHPRDIADPWYTGNFEDTYRDVLAGCTALLARLTG